MTFNPIYTVTIFFLGGHKAVIHPNHYTFDDHWLSLKVPGDGPDKNSFVYFNKDIIEKVVAQPFDPDADVEETPPPPEGPPNRILKEGDMNLNGSPPEDGPKDDIQIEQQEDCSEIHPPHADDERCGDRYYC